MKILTIDDVMSMYGFSRRYATKLLNTKGCPILPRKKNQIYRIPEEEFEKWMSDLKK